MLKVSRLLDQTLLPRILRGLVLAQHQQREMDTSEVNSPCEDINRGRLELGTLCDRSMIIYGEGDLGSS
jgi:hypothetical protein